MIGVRISPNAARLLAEQGIEVVSSTSDFTAWGQAGLASLTYDSGRGTILQESGASSAHEISEAVFPLILGKRYTLTLDVESGPAEDRTAIWLTLAYSTDLHQVWITGLDATPAVGYANDIVSCTFQDLGTHVRITFVFDAGVDSGLDNAVLTISCDDGFGSYIYAGDTGKYLAAKNLTVRRSA